MRDSSFYNTRASSAFPISHRTSRSPAEPVHGGHLARSRGAEPASESPAPLNAGKAASAFHRDRKSPQPPPPRSRRTPLALAWNGRSGDVDPGMHVRAISIRATADDPTGCLVPPQGLFAWPGARGERRGRMRDAKAGAHPTTAATEDGAPSHPRFDTSAGQAPGRASPSGPSRPGPETGEAPLARGLTCVQIFNCPSPVGPATVSSGTQM